MALVAGLAVGLFQALTSIQEMTLTFVPKLAAIVVVFWVSMGFMTETLAGLLARRHHSADRGVLRWRTRPMPR